MQKIGTDGFSQAGTEVWEVDDKEFVLAAVEAIGEAWTRFYSELSFKNQKEKCEQRIIDILQEESMKEKEPQSEKKALRKLNNGGWVRNQWNTPSQLALIPYWN